MVELEFVVGVTADHQASAEAEIEDLAHEALSGVQSVRVSIVQEGSRENIARGTMMVEDEALLTALGTDTIQSHVEPHVGEVSQFEVATVQGSTVAACGSVEVDKVALYKQRQDNLAIEFGEDKARDNCDLDAEIYCLNGNITKRASYPKDDPLGDGKIEVADYDILIQYDISHEAAINALPDELTHSLVNGRWRHIYKA